MDRPRNQLSAQPIPPLEDAAFDAAVTRWRGRGPSAVARALHLEIASQADEQRRADPIPPPGSPERDRLHRWSRARSWRIAVLAAATPGGGAPPRPPNAWGASPCEAVRDARGSSQ